MSWIGGLNDSFNKLSSVTGQLGGQLSNFTKEVLAEGTNEVVDYESEVKKVRIKLIEAEALVNEYEVQVEKLKRELTALEGKCRTNELQSHTRMLEYEAKLEKQCILIHKLKQSQADGSDNGFQIIHEHEFNRVSGRTFSGGSQDAAEYADVISSQREINHLAEELEKVQRECNRWKCLAQSSQTSDATGEDFLQAKIKELELQLHEEVDRHQHEYVALQQANVATVQRYQDENRVLLERLARNPADDIGESDINEADKFSQKMAIERMTSELEELKEKLRTRSRQLQAQKKSLEEKRSEMENQKKKTGDLELETKKKTVEIKDLLTEKSTLQKHVDENNRQLRNLIESINAALPTSEQLTDNSSSDAIIAHVNQLRESRDNYYDELSRVKDTVSRENLRTGNKEDLAESDQWHIESSEHSFVHSSDTEDQFDDRPEDDISKPSSSRNQKSHLPDYVGQPLYQSSPQSVRTKDNRPDENFLVVSNVNEADISQQGEFTLALQALQKQVEDYEVEIGQYELVKKEWQEEKNALQAVLDRFMKEHGTGVEKDGPDDLATDQRSATVTSLKNELQDLQEIRIAMENDKMRLLEEKEQLQTAAQNLKEELDLSIRETQSERSNLLSLQSGFEKALEEKKKLEEVLKNISNELNTSKMEKAELDEAIETLDAQHQDAMMELLQIRDDLSSRLKTSEKKLQEAQMENAKLMEEATPTNDSELANVREDLASLVDEKSSLEQQLEISNGQISDLKFKLQEMEELMLSAKTNAEEFKTKLEGVAKNCENSNLKFKELEKESEKCIQDLQWQVQEYVKALEEADARIDAVEVQRKNMEEKEKLTLSKIDALKIEHEKVISELDKFQEERKKSEHQYSSLIGSKDEEIAGLRKELEVLRVEEKTRIEEMTHNHEHEVATFQEVSTLKSDVVRIQERLETSNKGKDVLKRQIRDYEEKVLALEGELQRSRSEVNNLLKKLEEAEEKITVKVQESDMQHESKLMDVETKHQSNLAELVEAHKLEMSKMKNKHDAELTQIDDDHKRDLNMLVEECDRIKEHKVHQDAKVIALEDQISSETRVINEKLQQSSEARIKEIEVKALNKRLTDELSHERNLVEKQERGVKEQVKFHHNATDKHQLLVEELRSANAEEKILLQNMLEEEKLNIKMKMDNKIAQLDSEHRIKFLEMQNLHKEEIVKVNELNAKYERDITALQTHLLEVKSEAMMTEEELKRAQDDLKTLSKHLEQEKVKWKDEASSIIDELKMSHEKETLKLKQKLESGRNNADDAQLDKLAMVAKLSALEETNSRLLTEVEELKDMNQNQHNLDKIKLEENLKEISGLSVRLSDLSSTNERLRMDIVNLKSAEQSRVSTGNNLHSEYESELTALRAELKNLKMTTGTKERQVAATTSTNIHEMLEEIYTRDLNGLEKADLSKDDIGSLLALIKERDDVITALKEKNDSLNLKSASKAGDSDLEDRCKQFSEEKEQMLGVLSEKSRENRRLKDEVQKMMDIVAAEKNALSKIQDENLALIAKYDGFDEEMTKETVTKLSKLISEKDLEIESLKQKCQTLLDVLHQQENREASTTGGANEPTVSSQQIQSLLRDREMLSQQVRQLLTERDHLVALVNTKHQEALFFQEEALKAAKSLERDAAENSQLQISYSNLVHDYEQLEIKLSSVQKELRRFKESLNHLEESKEILLSKMDNGSSSSTASETKGISEVMENLRSGSSQSTGEKSREELESILLKRTESLLQKDLLIQETLDKFNKQEKEVQQLISDVREKDIIIHHKMEEVTRLSNDLAQKTNEVAILRKSVENLREQISSSAYEAELLREKVGNIEQSSQEKESELQAFQETNAQLSIMLKEREYEMEALSDKAASLSEILQRHEHGKDYESQKYLKELDMAKEQTNNAKHERDQIMLTLKQKQIESQRMSEEVRLLRDKEAKLKSELSRLRSHLVQVEETYTQEALLSCEREETLRSRLDQVQNSNASVMEASENSKQQIESLQEQIRSTAQQRDQAVHNFQLAKEQSAQYAAALQQLQMAAERMQRDEAATYSARVEKINQQYTERVKEFTVLTKQANELKTKLEEANIALESASRLNEQLEVKEQNIDQLKELVSEKQLQLEELQDNLHKVNAKSENMVDRQLVKNLLIGYFNSPENKQHDVKRLIASVIGFSKEEEMKLHHEKKGWMGGWLPWGRGGQISAPNHPSTHQHSQNEKLNESFTEMFVKFLENESISKQPARLPATAMVNEAQQRMNQRKIAAEGVPTPAFNPPHPENPGVPPEKSTVAGRYNPFLVSSTPSIGTSHPLIQPLTPILPTFAPITNNRPRDILQGILQSDVTTS